MDLFVLILIELLFLQYVIVIFLFLMEVYDVYKYHVTFPTKKSFLLNLIPFYWVITLLKMIYIGIKKLIKFPSNLYGKIKEHFYELELNQKKKG